MCNTATSITILEDSPDRTFQRRLRGRGRRDTRARTPGRPSPSPRRTTGPIHRFISAKSLTSSLVPKRKLKSTSPTLDRCALPCHLVTASPSMVPMDPSTTAGWPRRPN